MTTALTAADRGSIALLADQALYRARGGHLDEALDSMAEVFVHGRAGLVAMLHEWSTTLLHLLHRDPAAPAPLVIVEFVEPGKPLDRADPVAVGDLDHAQLWAGRWLAASAAEDHATCEALLQLPEDDWELLALAVTVLTTVSRTLAAACPVEAACPTSLRPAV